MRIDDFKKMKRLAESQDPAVLTEQALRVRDWMEETGRIDEGVWGTIWSWLKRNFSPMSLRLHRLADQYGDELKKEMKAEFGKIKDYKDAASRMRVSWAGKLSNDIEEKMRILAEDDPDYQELVRHLVNKKNLEAKKMILGSLEGIMSDEEMDNLRSENDAELDKEMKRGDAIIKKLAGKDREVARDSEKDLQKRISVEKRWYSFLDRKKEIGDYIRIVIAWTKKCAETSKDTVSFDTKTVLSFEEAIFDLLTEGSKRIRSEKMDEVAAMKALWKELSRFMEENMERPSDPSSPKFRSLLNTLMDKVSSHGEDSGDTPLTTDVSGEIIGDENVEDAEDTAAKEAGSDSEDKMRTEIFDFLREYLDDGNIKFLHKNLTKRVQKFNALKPADKKAAQGGLEYQLTNNGKLKDPSIKDIENLFLAFTRLAGAIVPYYIGKEESAKELSMTALRFIFELYACKKYPIPGAGTQVNIDDETRDKIVENIRKKYSDTFK